ncbi:protelomerase [Salmonella enterica subsp. enterica]|nr:protelomerase [Salmonella enterica subsp. enterica serovar Jangwani]
MTKLKGSGIGEIISNLVTKVDEIERSDIPQGDKTRKFKSLASKVKNSLYMDKRKYRGNGLKNRITANTYNTYMTRIRKQFDDRLHHNFAQTISRLAERYPVYADELNSWLDAPAAEIRQKLGALQNRLKEIMPLAEALSSIKAGPLSVKKYGRLVQKYPEWALYIGSLGTDDWKSAQEEIYQAFQQGERLLDDLGSLKVNHEILYHLQLSSAERASIQKRWDEVLGEKKRSTVLIDYPSYMQRVIDIITPEFTPTGTSRASLAPMAFALAAVSGRRMIEIMVQGEFEAVGRYQVKFYGQAKKRTGEDSGRTIYTLCDAALFVARLEQLRNAPAAADFDDIMGPGDDSYRSANARINTILAAPFNAFAKDFFGDERRVFKDTRAIYARIAYEAWFRYDARWQNVDEDVFFSEILGHDDENTQLHYKQFKLHNFSRSWRPGKGQENSRLAALQQLDGEMPGFARGDAGVRLHNAVKLLVEETPNAVINTNVLRKAGFNPLLVKRYLDFAAGALGQTVGENGWYETTEDLPPIVLNNDDHPEDFEDGDSDDSEIELSPDEGNDTTDRESTSDPDERPRFSAPVRTADGGWSVRFAYQGVQYVWNGAADNLADAMRSAWYAYFPKN